MTIYFPLVAHGAMLVEPTESESRASLDLYISTMRELCREALDGNQKKFQDAPVYTPRRRLDETQAARNPVLRWRDKTQAQAAE